MPIQTKAKLTNLNKVYWPKEGYTKGDLLNYYDKISKVLLPYLKNRAQSLNRFPNGIKKQNFFQKNVTGKLPPFVNTTKIHLEKEKRTDTSIVCDNKDTLLYLANLGCIEINPWSSRLSSLHNPDFAIIDLDPENVEFNRVIEAAVVVRKILDKAGIPSFPKTSGQSGLHIVIPLAAKYSYEQAKEFAHVIVMLTNQQLPNSTSLERKPQKRSKKVYLDFLQNNFGQTIACAYSVRPWPKATVSTPLEWKEVKPGLNPSAFNIKTIFSRLDKKGDLWRPTLKNGIKLERAIKQLERI